MRLRILSTLAGIALALVVFAPALAQTPASSPIVVTTQTLDMLFPRGMRFAIQAHSTAPIVVVRLTVWQRGVATGSRFAAAFTPAREVHTGFDWNFQSLTSGGYLPPGTSGEYTWNIQDAAGNALDTPRQQYVVQDRSQNWNTISNPDIRVSWYAGDAAFGSAVLQRALVARSFLTGQLGIQNVDPLEIFIYGDKQDFFSALPPFSAEWTGGRTFPEYGVIMINFAPANLDWGLRATSHELSHAVLHARIRGTLGDLSVPHWLDEGLAVYNETDAHVPDDQFEAAFQAAVRRNRLIPLRNMQLRFPDDSTQAELAYGEGYAAVKFMLDEYGKDKFADLLSIYQKGALPDEGLKQAYGLNQDELENAWRKKMGAPPREFSTFVLPTIAPQPTFEVSSPLAFPTATPTGPTPTAVATHVAEVEATAPSSVPPRAPGAPVIGLCGGVMLVLGGLGLVGARRRFKE